jgi:hypothetical protein
VRRALFGAPNQAQNPMPGKAGGFNNDEINGKSRNPDSTTPGTGPANLQQYGSADVHMTAVRGLDEESRHEHQNLSGGYDWNFDRAGFAAH